VGDRNGSRDPGQTGLDRPDSPQGRGTRLVAVHALSSELTACSFEFDEMSGEVCFFELSGASNEDQENDRKDNT
jgi:hypothetical protein